VVIFYLSPAPVLMLFPEIVLVSETIAIRLQFNKIFCNNNHATQSTFRQWSDSNCSVV